MRTASKTLAIEGGRPALDGAETPRLWPFYSDSAARRVAAAVRQGQVYSSGEGSACEELERRFASLHGPGTTALMCGSGTAALFASYFGLGLDRGAEVLAQTNGFRATVTPLLLLNLRPVLCDCDPVTGDLDLEDAERRITARTRAIVVTHLWGRPTDMDAIGSLAQRHGLAVVEDCSHAHGVAWQGRPAGTFGDVAAFSLGTKKLVSGGAAGMLLTRDREILDRALLLGQPKANALRRIVTPTLRDYAHSGLGANLRGNPLAATLALDHLDRLPHTIAVKEENCETLGNAIREALPALAPPTRGPDVTNGCWYSFRCLWSGAARRDAVVTALKAEGVRVEPPSPPLHELKLFRDASPLTSLDGVPAANWVDPSEFPGADRLTRQTVVWDTRELYEPPPGLLSAYRTALTKLAQSEERLLEH